MAGRYDQKFDYDFSPVTKSPEQPKRKRPDALETMLRLGSAAAPAVGTAIGAGVGSMAGGIGALPGAAIGGALGAGAGGLAGVGADMLAEPRLEEEDERMARENERKARADAALQMLGGF